MLDMLDILRDASSSILHDPNIWIVCMHLRFCSQKWAAHFSHKINRILKKGPDKVDLHILMFIFVRCSALVLSVSHLVLVTKNACRLSGVLDWIDQCLADVDEHLKVRKSYMAFLSVQAVFQPKQLHGQRNVHMGKLY